MLQTAECGRGAQGCSLSYYHLNPAAYRSALPVQEITNEPILDVLNSLLNPSQVTAIPYAAAFVLLLLAGLAYGKSASSSHMDLLVKWGRERISLPFPDASTTLGNLKEQLSEKTSLPVNQFKLVHAGAVMKDSNALLSAYGLKPGSKLTLIGTAAPLPTAREAASKPSIPRTQEGMLAIIKTELDSVHQKITPSLQTFLNSLSSPSSDPSSPPPEPRMVNPSAEDLQQEHTRIGELLLQSLLRLDAITPESEWEEARKARKAAVKEVQADLDTLDASWRAARTAIAANGSTNSPSSAIANGSIGKSKSKKRR